MCGSRFRRLRVSWTRSAKDSPIGLTVLLLLGSALAVPLLLSGWFAADDPDIDSSVGSVAFGVVVGCMGLYAAVYAAAGLFRLLRGYAATRRAPELAGRLEVLAVLLAYVAVVSGVVRLIPWQIAVLLVLTAAASSLAALIVRRRATTS